MHGGIFVKYDICIIGGGASGMMAALAAANSNSSVILIERNDKLGKKLAVTGNGKCNLTNLSMGLDNFYGDPTFIKAVMDKYNQDDLIRCMHSIGLYTSTNRENYVYPITESAKTDRKSVV